MSDFYDDDNEQDNNKEKHNKGDQNKDDLSIEEQNKDYPLKKNGWGGLRGDFLERLNNLPYAGFRVKIW